MSTRTRFEEEAKGNSEMAYYLFFIKFGFQLVNMKALLDLKLIGRGGIISNLLIQKNIDNATSFYYT